MLILYIISLFLSFIFLFWNVFLNMLTTSDIPPTYSREELVVYYISSIIMLLILFATIKLARNSKRKIFIVIILIFMFLLFMISDIVHSLDWIYYNTQIFLMDLTLVIEMLLIIIYGLYCILVKKRG